MPVSDGFRQSITYPPVAPGWLRLLAELEGPTGPEEAELLRAMKFSLARLLDTEEGRRRTGARRRARCGGLSRRRSALLQLWLKTWSIGYNRTMEATISLSEPLSETAFRLARQLGISLDELCVEAIEAYVRSRAEDERYHGVTATLDRIYADEPSKLEPGLARLQSAALETDEW